MTQRYTNSTNIDFAIAMWLAYDEYDHSATEGEFEISATSLMKPSKEVALSMLFPSDEMEDLSKLRASRTGSAVHAIAEDVFLDPAKREQAMSAMGMPPALQAKIMVNPEEPNWEQHLNVFVEQRKSKQVGKWTLSGKFDFYMEEMFQDYKNTGVYTYIKGTSDQHYVEQLSLYRWLNPELPSNGLGKIHMIFSDWKAFDAFRDNYPPADVITKTVTLWEPDQTQRFVESRLKDIEHNLACESQDSMTVCNKSQMWQDDPIYKYFAKADSARATKVFGNDAQAAHAHLASKGVGVVKEFHSPPRYCQSYCSARHVCEQGNVAVKTAEAK